MARHLVIVESPAKSRTLSKFLGENFDIASTIGHVIDLPKSKIGVDVDNNFQPEYVVIEGKQKVIADLLKAAKKADIVYLAPDPDREGEAIAWHVANCLKKATKAKLKRVTFNEITKTAVTEAIAHPRAIDMNLVNAQQARRVMDRLVGYMVSPFLWKTVAYNLSAGRVQSVALRLICEREAEIAAFTPEEYWKFSATLANKKKVEFVAQLFRVEDKTVVRAGEEGANKIVIGTKDQADKILAALKKATYTVSEIKSSERTRKPLAPFITSTLQQEAAKAHGLSPKHTMSIAQKLYEGIEIGKEGPTGLITYMRTDSTRIADEAIQAVRGYISKEYGDNYLPAHPNKYSKKDNAQDAHEAIRPTSMEMTPEKVKKHLTAHQLKLYTLIWNRFVASQMPDAKFSVETVDIKADKYILRASAQKLLFDGFLRVYHEEKEADDATGDNGLSESLPELSEGEKLALIELKPNQSFTKPPARYSEAMLVKRLEADGIGRPSTYANIISVIKDRKYVDLEERKLKPTDLGTTVSKVLVEHFPDIFNVEFTANMEKELDAVEDGSDEWVKVVKDFYTPFIKTMNAVKKKEKAIKQAMVEVTDTKCEKCDKFMVIKLGRNGRFLACSGWPECKSTKPLPGEEAKTKTDQKCDKCGADMVIKTGRFGRFMACSKYPDCKNAKPITLGITCPKPTCGGQLIEKKTKTRRAFYGCTNYPKCDFASWDKPVKQPCPVCHHAYMVFKVSKARGEHLRCPECKHEVLDHHPVEPTTVG